MYKPTTNDINLFQSLFNALKTAYTSGPMPTSISVAKPAPGPTGATGATGSTTDHDAPDAKGLVALTGLPSGNPFFGLRLAIQEIGLSLPLSSEQRGCCLNAVDQANAKYNVGQGFLGVATDSHLVHNQQTGEDVWVTTSPQVNIPDSYAFPSQMPITFQGKSYDCSKLAGVKDFVQAAAATPNKTVTQ